MKPQLEGSLWIAGILVFCAVGSHLGWMWRGRSVPSLADYVDFVGITFFLLSITIVTGLWKSRPNKPKDPVGNATRWLLTFGLKVIFLVVVPIGLLANWLRDWLFLGQRAMVYGAFALVATAGFVIASRLAASRKHAAVATAAAATANDG
jgi:hypothetical protein